MNNGKPSILVVEDENVVAMDLVSSLEKLHYPVAGVAATGEDAVELAESQRPGLVLMDIHLRGTIDGIRAAQQIQEKLFIPVVYLTAYSDDATLERARVTHPFGYLLKPFEDREIEVAIQIALFRHSMEQALRGSEQRLHSILSHIDDAVIATDGDRRITFLNKSAETLLGWKSERAHGRLLTDVLKTSSHDGRLRTLVRGKDVVPVEIVDSPVLDTYGKLSGYVTVARDLSERIRAQEAQERELVERGARAAAEKERERERLKGKVGLILADLAQPLDMSAALGRLANLLVPELADSCVIYLEDQGDPIRITAHADPERGRRADELQKRLQPDRNATRGTYAVMRTGQAEVVESIPEEVLEQSAGDAEQLEILRKLETKSYLCVPLRARQRVFGALTLLSTSENRRYQQSDVSFAQELADRAALAIDNARLYRDSVRAQEQLRQGEEAAAFLAAIVRSSQDAIVTKTLNGIITSWNEAAESMFGYRSDEVRGKPVTILIPTDRQHEEVQILAKLASGERIGQYETVRRRKDGSLVDVSLVISPIKDKTGRIIGASKVARDITEQKRALEAMERAVRFSEMFVGILGHDLRNPLSAITTAASLVLTRAESDRVAKPVSRILSSADRMGRMIDQILDFTHVRIGRGIPLQRKRTDLGDVCRLVLDELKGESEEAPDVGLDLHGDPTGEWDEDRLSQLLSNLAGNAVQHRPRGTRVAVSVDGTSPERVRVEVHNDGVIPSEIVPVIFEPFRSGTDKKREGSSGLGLGLYISQQIVLAHRGSIWAETDAARGTRFIVELPRTPPPRAEQVFSVGEALLSEPK